MVPNFEACDETRHRQKCPKSSFFFFKFLTAALQKNAHNSFILRPIKKTKRHLVRHVILIRMVHDLSRDHKMAASYFESAFYFQKKKTFYFIVPYRSSSLSQGKSF